jgi:hypothetical protein
MIAAEDKISQAKADAYGDSIVKAAIEADERKRIAGEIQQAEELSSDEITRLKMQMYDAVKSAAQSLADIVNSNAQTEMDAIDEATELAIANGADEVEAKKEGEKQKAKIKYDADLYSWNTNLLLALADAAKAIIVGYAQLGPIGGSIAGLITAGVTGFQIAAMKAAKPAAPALARGSDFTQGGATLVGEEGPELVNMPRGASVTPNSRGGTGGGPTFIINSPVAVTPSVAAQEYTRMVRNLAFEGVL